MFYTFYCTKKIKDPWHDLNLKSAKDNLYPIVLLRIKKGYHFLFCEKEA